MHPVNRLSRVCGTESLWLRAGPCPATHLPAPCPGFLPGMHQASHTTPPCCFMPTSLPSLLPGLPSPHLGPSGCSAACAGARAGGRHAAAPLQVLDVQAGQRVQLAVNSRDTLLKGGKPLFDVCMQKERAAADPGNRDSPGAANGPDPVFSDPDSQRCPHSIAAIVTAAAAAAAAAAAPARGRAAGAAG